MRTSTVLATILVIGLVLFLGGWFRTQSNLTAALPPALSAPTQPQAIAAAPIETVSTHPVIPGQTPETIENQIAALESLSRNDDATSLDHILAGLHDPDPEIRATAVDAAIQFGSPDAIPALEAASMKTEIPLEKVKLQEAIEFLALPPLVVNTATNQP